MSMYNNETWYKKTWNGFKNYTDGKLIWLVPLLQTYGVYRVNSTSNPDIKTKILEGLYIGAGFFLAGALDYYLGGKKTQQKIKRNRRSEETNKIQL